jgi:hypothetical protein
MEKILEIFKKFKTVDLIIIAGIILALIVGFFTFKNFRQTASNQIEATSKISFQVFIRGVTLTGNEIPLQANDKTFISIRNVPYSDLDIISVKADRKKVVLPVLNSKKVMIVEDVSQANMYDITVTLTDTAKITKDGAVVGGNKIKIGLPITLEGKDYKFNGTVSDLKVMPETNDNKFNDAINTNNDVQ